MKRLYLICFITCLSLPILLFTIGVNPPTINIGENRKLASRPDISDISPLKIERYFSDHLPFRTQFTARYIQIWETGLSSWVRRNFKGKNGHYYINLPIAPTVERYLGLKPLSKQQLYDIRTILLGMQAFWKHRNIRFLSAFIPDKPNLYPEYLPFWMTRKHSWSDQLQPLLTNTSLNYLDFTPILAKQKRKGLIYNKRFDVQHWNGFGLAIAHSVITQKLNLPVSAVMPYKLTSKFVKSLLLLGEEVPWMDMNKEYLEFQPNPYNLKKGLAAMVKVVNQKAEEENQVLLFLTDSYFKGTHINTYSKDYGGIFPLAHNVRTYFHGHYRHVKFSDLYKIAHQEKPTAVMIAFAERAASNFSQISLPAFVMIAGERLSKDSHYELAPDASYQPINATLTKMETGLSVESQNDDPQLLLPNQTTNKKDGRIAIMAKLYSPHDTSCQLFYAQVDENFSEEQSVRVKVKKGLNYIHMQVFSKKNTLIRLRFDPGKKQGVYRLSAIPATAELFEEK